MSGSESSPMCITDGSLVCQPAKRVVGHTTWACRHLLDAGSDTRVYQ